MNKQYHTQTFERSGKLTSIYKPQPACPRCGRSDLVQKVAIHGTWADSQAGIPLKNIRWNGSNFMVVSAVAARGLPYVRPPGYWAQVFQYLLVVLVTLLMGMQILRGEVDLPKGFVTVLRLLTIFSPLDLAVMVGSGSLKKGVNRRLKRYQEALDVWERGYYCCRDDGIFWSGSGRFITLRNLNKSIARAE